MTEIYPDAPGYENRDTSFAAAQTVDAGALRSLVMLAHENHRVSGLTDDELDEFRPANCPTLRPRRCELTQKGVLADTGRRRLSRRGRRMIVWGLIC